MSSSLVSGRPATADGTTAGAAATDTRHLRTLYYWRFGFAVIWAGLLALTASALSPLSIALLLIYPLFDVAAAVIDLRTSDAARPTRLLQINMALSLLAAAGLAAAVTSGIPSVLRVWGAWAITAGVVQLIVAIQRHRGGMVSGGQWPMILSGGISTIAGTGFILMAGGAGASLTTLTGYATLGGIFFAVSAFRMQRKAAGQR